MVQLQNEAQRQQFRSSAWIGLWNDINSWRWSIGNEPLGNLINWYPGEPNNVGGHEECGMINVLGFFDTDCAGKLPFVCFDARRSGSESYIYVLNQMTWPEAQSYCKQHHTDLASVPDRTVSSIIMPLISGNTYIGLFRDSWKWTDRSNVSVIRWMTGQPDNGKGNENCGYLDNGQAADTQCSMTMPFFCYSEIRKKMQVIRVKVQSGQDVNNLDIKSAVVEQIRQKLKDHGMAENTTVKWREQPDGEEFYKEKERSVK
ncbi:C-type mannose receptor 2-like [Hemibagrus wyckioides]|uniref:C-type mannose receptor 2-like n=1 Tax=Hemibagrus wyckioides TaxID=337641 RepID=UPI00266B5E5B|nr:C-type mannose receptor 2-like [Hemibagrus wyckioides]